MTDTADFASEIHELWEAAEEADKANRKEALLDLEFAAGEQWDEQVRQQRENRPGEVSLPCLTINTIPQFVGQVIGDRRANATSIKVLPREDGDKEIADVRSELIRSIELQSKAQRVYSQSFEQAVTCGVGNFRIDLDYAYDDAFERDLFIRGIANPLAVLWDPMAGDPTGRDAGYCFVQERIRREDYKARFGEEATESLNDSSTSGKSDWIDGETVRIAELWQMTEKPKTVAMGQDGKIVDVTGAKIEQGIAVIPGKYGAQPSLVQLMLNPSTGEPYIRETKCKYATRTLTNGKEQLEDPFELKIPRVPIIRVMGREVWIGDKRVRFGLVRFARDPQRLKNYMRSVWAQKLMFAPRHNWIGPAKAFAGLEGDFSDVLMFNDNAPFPPQPATQNNLRDFLTGSEVFAQDMKDTTGIHEASLGMQGNETSGIAIRNRQHEGDIATIIYHDNMNASMQEGGEILNELIPLVYDTARTIRTVGEDDGVKLIRINDPMHPESVDLGLGRYDVTISTGPAYMTKRIEAASQLSEMAARNPKLTDVAGDLIIKAMDIPDGDKIAERIKKTLPPNLIEGEDEPTPEELQAKAEAEAEAQEMKALAKREAIAKTVEAEAKAQKAMKEAEDAMQGLNKQTVDATNAETARLKAITAKDFPLGPTAQAILAPLVTQAVMTVLQSPDVLPLGLQLGIAADAHDQAMQPDPAELAAAQAPQPMEGEAS